MSKHNRARKRRAEAKPPSLLGDKSAGPRGSWDDRGHRSAMTDYREPANDPGWRPVLTNEEIAVRAYGLWQAKGRPQGDGLEDWYEAERQLRAGNPEVGTGLGHAAATEAAVVGSPTRPDAGPARGGEPQRTHAVVAEQAREARESEEARRAVPTNRQRMVDIGRGNQQAGRGGE